MSLDASAQKKFASAPRCGTKFRVKTQQKPGALFSLSSRGTMEERAGERRPSSWDCPSPPSCLTGRKFPERKFHALNPGTSTPQRGGGYQPRVARLASPARTELPWVQTPKDSSPSPPAAGGEGRGEEVFFIGLPLPFVPHGGTAPRNLNRFRCIFCGKN